MVEYSTKLLKKCLGLFTVKKKFVEDTKTMNVYSNNNLSDTHMLGKNVYIFLPSIFQLERIHVRVCRYNERLKVKTDGCTRLGYTG